MAWHHEFFRIWICWASCFCIYSFQSEDSSPSPSVQQHLFEINFFLWLTQKAPWLWCFLCVCFSSFDSCFWSQLAVPKSRDYWYILLNVHLQVGPQTGCLWWTLACSSCSAAPGSRSRRWKSGLFPLRTHCSVLMRRHPHPQKCAFKVFWNFCSSS